MKRKLENQLAGSRFLSNLYAIKKYIQLSADISLKKELESTLSDFVSGLTPAQSCRMKLILLYHRYYYQVSFYEYFLFHFDKLNHKGKKEFIGDLERKKICRQLIRTEDMNYVRNFFKNKYLTYERFHAFYHRKILFLDENTDLSELESFAATHDTALLKPANGSLGKHIQLIRMKEIENLSQWLIKIISEKKEAVLEECILQAEEMAVFHPSSVNTIRLGSYYDGKIVIPLFSCFRMGVGDAVVDNTGSGGIGAAVDVSNGIVITAGMNKKGKTYLCHPDTHQQIIGFCIPHWKELLAIVEQLAKAIPECPYIAWDFALTPEGWCMVEANGAGQFGNQYRENRGYRTMIETYFRPVDQKG